MADAIETIRELSVEELNKVAGGNMGDPTVPGYTEFWANLPNGGFGGGAGHPQPLQA